MSKKSSSDDANDSNETTEQALAALTVQIKEFVQNRSLDSRFAAKLVKRLKKESELVVENGHSVQSARRTLEEALRAIDAELREHDAKLLVAANAALRRADDSQATR